MRILIVSKSDLEGGAARAAYRQLRSLRDAGVDARMVVAVKKSSDPSVIKIPMLNLFLTYVAIVIERIFFKFQKTRNSIQHSLNWFPTGVGRYINSLNADVVHMHWINGGLLSLIEIKNLKGKVVWTMHDMWVFLGSEHYDHPTQPGRYLRAYKDPQPSGDTGIDLNKISYKLKLSSLAKREIHYASPSQWLADRFQESEIGKKMKCKVLPNGAPSEVYRPIPQLEARQLLGLPADKKIIIFGAMNATKDPRKGFQHLKNGLEILGKRLDVSKLLCVVMGAGPAKGSVAGIDSLEVGTLNDDIALSLYYNAADVFVCPSEQENLPNTLVEASLCGLPSLCFEIGGNKEIIGDIGIGEIVKPFVATEFADKLERILTTELEWSKRISSSEIAQRKYGFQSFAKRTVDFYESLGEM